VLSWRWAACGLALAVLAGCGGGYKDEVYRLPQAQRDVLCGQTRAATEKMAEDAEAKGLDFPEDDAQRVGQEACQNAQYVVPEPTPVPVSAPGCPEIVDAPRPARIDRRTRRRPRGLRAPFAPRAGKLPADGQATIAGVELPAGSRCGNHWTLDAATPQALSLARHLASAFPQTGLWPVLWTQGDDPDAYLFTGSDPADADGLDVHAVLEKLWQAPIGPLAPPADGRPPDDPFGVLQRSGELGGYAVLILVPVNRPADVGSVLGVSQSEVVSDAQTTAVLRSWEERFGAVVTGVGPGTVELSVGSPPTLPHQALRLANEQMAFAPDSYPPSAVPDRARELLTSEVWGFGWPD